MPDNPSCTQENVDNFLKEMQAINVLIIFNGKQINLSNIENPIETHYSYD